MRLKDLRVQYPDIKATSVERFLELVEDKKLLDTQPEEMSEPLIVTPLPSEGLSDDLIVTDKLADIQKLMPDYLNKSIAEYTGCECWEENLTYLLEVRMAVTADMQDSIIQFFKDKFKMNIKRTQCSPCIKDRIDRIREYFNTRL